MEAVPLLLRKIFAFRNYHDCALSRRPIKCGDIRTAMQSDKFLKLYNYAAHDPEIDGIIIALDCEDHCVLQAVHTIQGRVLPIAHLKQKPTAVTLFYREYESMFLAALPDLAARSQRTVFNEEAVRAPLDFESVRDAKGAVTRALSGTSYKERRDQPRLTDLIDIGVDAARYRPLAHMLNSVDWLYTWPGARFVYS